jgi:alpha-D-ribose 1-methylphosphonate 5-triphosphate synthase subunit PhnG
LAQASSHADSDDVLDRLAADNDGRRAAMAVLARSDARALARALSSVGDVEFTEVRPPESGLVMLRGRIGGDGAPFNVGEATVTRAAVKLASGETGFSYVLGRDEEKARLAALCDALWQSAVHRPHIEEHVLTPLRAAQEARAAHTRAEAAATRVDFFTLVRGENEK